MALLRRVFISLLMVLTLNGVVEAPQLRGPPGFYQDLTIDFIEYWGYQKLAGQVGWSAVQEVVNLIEGSVYPALVKSIISVESNWDAFARSPRDAYGLMQVRMIAAVEVELDIEYFDLYDPVLNVRIGIAIFERHMEYFMGFDAAEHWALTSYNRGRCGAFELNLDPPRTRYSQKVLGLIENDSLSLGNTGAKNG